jgi:hypothetical protein
MSDHMDYKEGLVRGRIQGATIVASILALVFSLMALMGL